MGKVTPAFSAGSDRSGKPVQQHALVIHFMAHTQLSFHFENLASCMKTYISSIKAPITEPITIS